MKTKEFFQQVSLNEIQPNEANVRECFDNASIQELADSIQNSGLINPLTLRSVGKNQYAIICGVRRFRAAQLLGWKSINAYKRGHQRVNFPYRKKRKIYPCTFKT